jgi:UDP-GlcNAc3NAcA epimerase
VTRRRRILTVVGARPQFIKAAAVSRRFADPQFSMLEEAIVHTGQHYDDGMSGTFFRDLEIPEPRWNLGAGGGGHGAQLGSMTSGLERVLEDWVPDMLMVYGDTNSTLAGALVAAKAGLRLAHVEAGLRSFRRGMAEEVNRVVTDRLSDLLFCPTGAAVANLAAEGRNAGVHLVGDVMYDTFLRSAAKLNSDALSRHGLERRRFLLATVHRAENTDDRVRLASLFAALSQVAREFPVLLPLHPRTRKALADASIAPADGIRIVDPLPYGELMSIMANAAAVVTDSGGMQKEAYFAAVPCVTLRDETEWTETVEAGWNRLAPPAHDPGAAGLIATAILSAVASRPGVTPPQIYGDGDAAGKILNVIAAHA